MRAALPLLRRHNDRRGANAVEFALTAPILFFLVLSTMDVGWFFGHSIALDAVSSEVARRAAIRMQHTDGTSTMDPGYAATEADGVAMWQQFGLPGDDEIDFTVSLVTVSGVPMVQVVGTVPYNDFGGWNGLLGPSLQIFPDDLTTTVVRRAENTLTAPDANAN